MFPPQPFAVNWRTGDPQRVVQNDVWYPELLTHISSVPHQRPANDPHKDEGNARPGVANYFDLKTALAGRPRSAAVAGWVLSSPGIPGQAARALILIRLWVRTPCPVQIRAPCV